MKIVIFKIIHKIIKTKDKTKIYPNQPDIFQPYTQKQHVRQPRPNLASQNNNVYSQKPANTDSYQPTQMQKEIPLPYYLQ